MPCNFIAEVIGFLAFLARQPVELLLQVTVSVFTSCDGM